MGPRMIRGLESSEIADEVLRVHSTWNIIQLNVYNTMKSPLYQSDDARLHAKVY